MKKHYTYIIARQLYFGRFSKLKISEHLTRAKVWVQRMVTGRENRPKIPRKKLQIQFERGREQFEEQVQQLERRLSLPGLARSSQQVGNYLMQDVQRFKELHLIRINQNRLETLSQPLVHPIDFSLWVLYQMYAFTEEIFHYLKTCEVTTL